MKSNRSILLPLAIVFGILFTQATPAFAHRDDSTSALDGVTWYVATTGDNINNDCLSPSTPCATINGAITRTTNGDTVLVAEGIYTYTGTGSMVVDVTKSIVLSGGWDSLFTIKNGYTTVDGEKAHRGIFLRAPGEVFIDRFIVKNGRSFYSDVWGQGGAGIQANSSLTLSNSLVQGNQAATGGGGISVYETNLKIYNSTISNNKANGGGGGILFHNPSSLKTLIINNSTIAFNIAGIGGGLYIYDYTPVGPGGETIRNTIIANNIASSNSDCKTFTGIDQASHNIIMNPDGCTLPEDGNNAVDPLLTPGVIENFGYYALIANSPAIDAGSSDCLGSDQRGILRPQGDACDIGAYELPSVISSDDASLMILGGNDQRTFPGDSFPLPIYIGLINPNGDLVAQSGLEITLSAPESGPSLTFNDTGNISSLITTNQYGIATSSSITSNNQAGEYTVSASADGYSPATVKLLNALWFVSTTGNDSNSCNSPSLPCATIAGVFAKKNLIAGDMIKVSTGIYSLTKELKVPRDVILSGGWTMDFLSQSGFSTLDGNHQVQTLHIGNSNTDSIKDVKIDRFIIKNSTSYGITNESQKLLTIINSSIVNNNGGGILNFGPALNLTNVVIADNINSNNYGGGIHTRTAIININNSTIVHNSGFEGGGIYSDVNNGASQIFLKNTIVANNVSLNDAREDCKGPITSQGNNIISNTTGCGLTPTSGDRFGVNPLISPSPVNNPDLYILNPDSPAVDAGNPLTCSSMDERGIARPQGIACDIGAYEYIPITISGNATIEGVSLGYIHGGITRSSTTDESGDYSLYVSSDWSGTVTPSKLGWSFTPDHLDYTNVLTNQLSQNYTATRYAYVIAGNVGRAGVTLNYEDNGTKSVVSGSDGSYKLPVSLDWSGAVTPSKDGYTFSPEKIDYTNVSSDVPLQNYTPTGITYTISGNAGIAGAVINYMNGTTLADDNGFYSFTVSYNWSGTVTPSYTGYKFSPANKIYINVLSNQLQDYSATVITIPTLILPRGANIDQTPTFKWTKILGATQYQYQLYKGNTRIYAKTVPANVCTLTTCLDTPTTKIMDGKYKWQVRAFVNGAWQPHTSFKPFTMGPKVGYWSGRGNDFYVVPNQSRIENFAIYIQVSGCGSYQIMHPNRINIVNQSFAFGSSFYANGTFRNTHTRATGTVGLNSFYIPGCGYVSGGPFSWVSNWIDTSQPSAMLRESGIPAIMDLPSLLDQHPSPFIFTVDPE
jgi:hypothetical protein